MGFEGGDGGVDTMLARRTFLTFSVNQFVCCGARFLGRRYCLTVRRIQPQPDVTANQHVKRFI